MNLTEALAHQPVERLRQIVSQRRIVFRSQVKDRGELIDGLAQVLGANAHPWNVLSLLDRAELHLLRTLAKTSGEIVDGRQLRNAFPNGMPKDELRRIVASLGDKGMLLPVNNDQYYLPRPISRAFASEGNSTNLRSCLLQLQVSQLQQLCAQFNCPAQPARKNDLVDRLCTALSRPATAKALVEALPAPARKLFDVLFAASGPLTVDRLLQEVPRDRRSHVRYYWQWGPYTYMGVGDNELVQIQRSGLAYAPNGPRLPTLLVIPDEIRWAVQGRPEQSIAQFLPPSAETPAAGTTFRSHDTLLPDIVRALVFLQQERPEALKSGGFPKQALRKLSQKLTVTDVNYGGFVLALLFELDMAGREQGHFLPLEGADAWLTQDVGAQVSSLGLRWINTRSWSELSEEPFALGAYGSAALTALRSTLPWAAAMPSAGASLDSFRALVEFLRPAIVSSLEQEVDWPATFDRLVASLHWLGLIQRSVGSPPTVRPAQLLEALFGPTTQPARVDSFVVQPNLEIVAPPNLNLVVLRQLLQLAEGPAVAGAIVVRLTLGSLRAALDCGWTGESILAFLSEHSSTPIAQTVRRAIQDVAAQYGAIELGSAEIYLKAATPALMQELLALSSLRQVVRPLTDTVALVAKADEAKVAATLRQAGKLPHVIDDVPRTARRREQYSGPQPARTFEPNWDSLAHSDEPVPQRPKRARSDGPILQRPERAPSNGHQEAAIPIEVDVLLAAIESGQDVEIRYQNAKGAMSTRLIEPYDLDEEHLYAYCHSANQEMTFKLRNIVWARPADAQLCLI